MTIGGVKCKFVSSDTGVNENEYWVTYTADITLASDRTPGDLNGDKTVDLKDGLLISQHLAGWKVKINESNADVNGDKTVDLKDGLLLQQHLAGWKVAVNETNSDVNGDGVIDLKDGILLKQFLAGWKVTLK